MAPRTKQFIVYHKGEEGGGMSFPIAYFSTREKAASAGRSTRDRLPYVVLYEYY